MKSLIKLKIRSKIMLIVVTLIASILLVGIIGTVNQINARKALNKVYAENMTSIIYLSDLRTQSRGNYANLLNLIINTDAQKQKQILENIEKRIGAINDDLKQFESRPLSSKDQEMLTAIKDKQKSWNTVRDQIRDQVIAGNQKEATAIFMSQGETIFEDLQTAIRDTVKYQQDLADSVYRQCIKEGNTAEFFMILLIIVTVLISLILSFQVSISITGPIKKLMALIQTTAALNLEDNDEYDHMLMYQDEVGDITREVSELRSSLRTTCRTLHQISAGILENAKEVADSSEESTGTVNQIAVSISEIAEGNSSQAGEVTTISQNVMKMAGNMEQINAASSTSSLSAGQAIDMIEEGQQAIELTVDKIKKSAQVADRVNTSIGELSEQMKKVGAIVDVIRQISSQTNLLALNASIEAARAGDAGRGFAVVASEIGNLSNSTASAVDDIIVIIEQAVSKNRATSEKVNEVRSIVLEQESAIQIMEKSFIQIEDVVRKIAEQTHVISDEVNETTALSESISTRMQDFAAIAEQTAAGSEEISASAQEQLATVEMLSKIAQDLKIMADSLSGETGRFRI